MLRAYGRNNISLFPFQFDANEGPVKTPTASPISKKSELGNIPEEPLPNQDTEMEMMTAPPLNSPNVTSRVPRKSHSADSSDSSSSKNTFTRNGHSLKSGHGRTHAIVINLDDKSRFTEEVTV